MVTTVKHLTTLVAGSLSRVRLRSSVVASRAHNYWLYVLPHFIAVIQQTSSFVCLGFTTKFGALLVRVHGGRVSQK